MHKALSIITLFVFFSFPVKAQEASVVLYCQAPNAACDAAASHLEGHGIEYRHVYAWSTEGSYRRVQGLANHGVRLDGESAIVQVNDSFGVGMDGIRRLIQFVF